MAVKEKLSGLPLNHRHPTVDVNRLTGHIGGFFGGEEDDRRCDISHGTKASNGDFFHQFALLFIIQHVRHRRHDKARRDAVDRHIASGHFLSEGF